MILKTQEMVYSTLTDRVGNMLFQIAAGASLAYKNSSDFIACVSETTVPDGTRLIEYLKPFKNNIFRNIKIVEGIPEDSVEFNQQGFEYSPIPYQENILLKGYFQSEKYFGKNFIKNLFAIDSSSYEYIENKYGHLLKQDIISIHVRRGDYVKRPLRQPVCEMPYFKRAIRFFGKSRQFLIVSDDIEWCKKKFKGENFHFTQNESPIIDLYIQSLCAHNIISNSSFSWWGAWLNSNESKIVIAPKKWFGVQMKSYNLSDLIPDNWIKIDNPRTPSLQIKIFFYWFIDVFKRIRRRATGIFQYLYLNIKHFRKL